MSSEPFRIEALRPYLDAAARAGVAPYPELAERLRARSLFLTRAIERDPALLSEVAEGRWLERNKTEAAFLSEAREIPATGFDAGLRRWRRRETLGIVLRETATRDLVQAMRELSDLAAAAIDAALVMTQMVQEERHGQEPCPFVVMGMGKLGGRELNLSSDVDLLYVYEADAGEHAHEWFRGLCQKLTRRIAEPTDAGYAYRVDLRLRPEGRAGPICNSLGAIERYYEAWGHGWERLAWLRARPVAGDRRLGERLLEALRPFVYRRHLDLGAIREVGTMKARVENASHGRPEMDVKLGPGGIRELEFFVQALQLVHGGRIPAIRDRSTLGALDRLRAAGLVPTDEHDDLAAAYLYLRALEHQVQLVDDRQTHELPRAPESLSFVARGLGHESTDTLLEALGRHRRVVTAAWTGLLSGVDLGEEVDWADIDGVVDGSEAALARLGDLGPRAAEHLASLRRSPKSPLHESRLARSREPARILVRELLATPDADQALTLLRDLVRTLRPDTGLWELLSRHEQRLRALVQLLGHSRFLGALVARHPHLLEEVILGGAAPPRPERRELQAMFRDLPAEQAEQALVRARALHHAEVLRIGFYDVAGELDPEETNAQLTALAEESIAAVLRIAEAEMGVTPGGGLAVVALGALGASEMTYGSDVDLMFLYEGDHRGVSRLARRVLNGLSLPMVTGRLYDVDTRLRPSGNQGPLLVTADALARYHEARSAVWEQQALLRARFVAGDPELCRRFEHVRLSVLERPRDREAICAEVRRVHERHVAEVARESADRVDLKYGRGGTLEIDLVVQTLRLLDAGRTASLAPLPTHEALAELARASLLPQDDVDVLLAAHRFLRTLESRLRIMCDRGEHQVDLGDVKLARRLGFHDVPGLCGTSALRAAYSRHTCSVRRIYEEVVGEGRQK